MHKLAILSIALTACAGGAAGSRDGLAERRAAFAATSAEQTGAAISTAGAEQTEAVFPAALAPQLPRVDRLSHQLRGEVGDQVSAELTLCVRASGEVDEVHVVRGSRSAAFDRAVVRDVSEWRFAPMPGARTLRTCGQRTIAYRAP